MTGTPDDKEGVEIRFLYQDNIDNIRDLKRQQWSVTYYSILLYAALVGITEVARNNYILELWWTYILSGLTIFVGVASVGLLIHGQYMLKKRRERIHALRSQFTHQGRVWYGSPKERHTSFRYTWPIWSLMISVTLIGLVLVNWIIWWPPAC